MKPTTKGETKRMPAQVVGNQVAAIRAGAERATRVRTNSRAAL
jgi:hypothetical protein